MLNTNTRDDGDYLSFINALGAPTAFSLSVQPSNNYPLDVYLLTDLSYSFRDDLTNLKALGSKIGKHFLPDDDDDGDDDDDDAICHHLQRNCNPEHI